MILVDKNEPEEIFNNLVQMDLEVRRSDIEFYDYIVEGKCGSVAVERKEIGDFLISVMDGRIYYQTYKMSHDFDTSFLTVIGDINLHLVERATVTGITRDELRRTYLGALLGVALRRSPDGRCGRVHPIVLPDLEAFVEFLALLQKKLDQSDLFRLPVSGQRTEDGNYMVAMLMCIPGVGREKAKMIYQRFGSMESLVRADVRQIASVKGVGEKLAKRVFKALR